MSPDWLGKITRLLPLISSFDSATLSGKLDGRHPNSTDIHNPLAVESDLLATPSRGLSSFFPAAEERVASCGTHYRRTNRTGLRKQVHTYTHTRTHSSPSPQPSAVALILGEKQDILNEIFY